MRTACRSGSGSRNLRQSRTKSISLSASEPCAMSPTAASNAERWRARGARTSASRKAGGRVRRCWTAAARMPHAGRADANVAAARTNASGNACTMLPGRVRTSSHRDDRCSRTLTGHPASQARPAGCQYVDRLPLPAPQPERLRSRERRQDRQRPRVRARDRPALTLRERAVVQHDREPQPLPPSGVELRLDASTADAASLQRSRCGDATCVGLRQCLGIHLLIVGIGGACSQHRRRICGSATRTRNRCAYRLARTCRSAHDQQARAANQPRRSLSAAMSLG